MAVTIRDVAAAANVSVATVSRVLTGKDRVSAEKRQAVLRACRDLHYEPDVLAASLRSRSSSTIGMLVPDITNPFFPAVVQAAEQEFAHVGLDIVFCDSNNDVTTEARRLQTLLRRRVDALLVCPVHVKDSASGLRTAAASTRVLQLERRAVDDLDFLGVDQASGMNQVVSHLSSVGVRSAVFAGLNVGMSSIWERAEAFHRACTAYSITSWPPAEVRFPDVEHGREFARWLINDATLPDAVVCANDELAFGVLLELRKAGIRCPDDVKITGYDNVPAAELLELTSVAQPLHALGREAARMITQDSSTPRHLLLTPAIVLRASSE